MLYNMQIIDKRHNINYYSCIVTRFRGIAMKISLSSTRPAGYAFLLSKYEITGMPNWHVSYVSVNTTHRIEMHTGFIKETFSAKYWPGDSPGNHLEFALKYDGVNLSLLKQIFNLIPKEVIEYIKSKPTGKYSRRIWFFYEFLTGELLPIDDIKQGNYVEALESNKYFTVSNAENSTRHRVVNNLLGAREFCPVIRKSENLQKAVSLDLYHRVKDITMSYPTELIKRALNYLYKKETKSSFEIENIKPSSSRIEKFITSLELAGKEDYCNKDLLIKLQKLIVDPRFKNNNYRDTQNYVGQSVSYQNELIHFVCPKPEDVDDLMRGLIIAHEKMKNGNVPPVIHAAAIAYGFVYIHPFDDGNGRIHRFLIHNILSIRNVVPQGLMFPVSAVMLKNPSEYDASLEGFSRPLLSFVEYKLDSLGEMTVGNNTKIFYKYIDMTIQAEYLYDFILQTIDEELINELDFLINYDKTKTKIQGVIDMPDRLIDLFIRVCIQNSGQLSNSKRESHFNFLSEEELLAMENAIKESYNPKLK